MMMLLCFTALSNNWFYRNPLLTGIGDPFILEYNGVYYLYGTCDEVSSQGFEVFYSRDLIHWIKHDKLALKVGDNNWGKSQFWAPEVIYKNGRFYMFYSALEDYRKGQRIFVAVSDSPLGPFTKYSEGPLIDEWSNDPHYFKDEDGQEYLFFNYKWVDTIAVAKLTPDLKKIYDVRICISARTDPEEWVTEPVNEGPYVIKHKGFYYLFYSGNGYTSPDYGVGYAVAKNPMGPWKKYPKNPVLFKKGNIQGTGHNSFIRSPDGKELFIVYHKHFSSSDVTPRQVCIDRVVFLSKDNEADVVKVLGPTESFQPAPSGAIPPDHPKVGEVWPDLELMDYEKEQIKQVVQNEYNLQLSKGFNPGYPAPNIYGNVGYVHEWWGTLVQFFVNGDSESVIAGKYFPLYPKITLIFVIRKNGKYEAFTVKNEILDVFLSVGGPMVCGVPVSDEFEKDGLMVQNFQNGAIIGDKWKRGAQISPP